MDSIWVLMCLALLSGKNYYDTDELNYLDYYKKYGDDE